MVIVFTHIHQCNPGMWLVGSSRTSPQKKGPRFDKLGQHKNKTCGNLFEKISNK